MALGSGNSGSGNGIGIGGGNNSAVGRTSAESMTPWPM